MHALKRDHVFLKGMCDPPSLPGLAESTGDLETINRNRHHTSEKTSEKTMRRDPRRPGSRNNRGRHGSSTGFFAAMDCCPLKVCLNLSKNTPGRGRSHSSAHCTISTI